MSKESLDDRRPWWCPERYAYIWRRAGTCENEQDRDDADCFLPADVFDAMPGGGDEPGVKEYNFKERALLRLEQAIEAAGRPA